MKKANSTLRNLMLDLYQVGESMNAFEYTLRLMVALKEDKITNEQFILLAGDLKMHCERNNISTKNEICSLF